MENELPKFQCKKIVSAVKIRRVDPIINRPSVMIYHDSPNVSPVSADNKWMMRYLPDGNDLGYYVRYSDGFESWSPSKAFEEGYDLIED